MGAIEGRYFSSAGMIQCSLLSDFFSSIADRVFVSLDCGGRRQVLTSEPTWGLAHLESLRSGLVADGPLVVTQADLGASDLSTLLDLETDAIGGGTWWAFRCRFASGAEDIVALRNVAQPGEAAKFLKTAWSALRRACTKAQTQSGSDLSDDALLWVINQKVNAAILVIDEQCRVLRTNAAADEFLAEGRLLRNGPSGLVCANRKETDALRAAVRESYGDGSGNEPEKQSEFILLLRGKSGTAHMPMSLSTYVQAETGARLILLMLPRPPDHDRIEGLARRLGLTPSEARVAALIREGHSNKEAAEIAGLKIETFNTYAKRALSKMNVKCRAEMAQMLTWQAALERP